MTLIMFFEFLISLTDVYVAGKISKEVQAAYGFVIQIYFISIVIANALTVGTVSVVSRIFTAQETRERENALSGAVFSAVATSGVAGLAVCGIGLIALPHIIGWLSIPDGLKEYVLPLGRIYLVGIFFHYVLINGNGVLRSCGMVKKSLRTMAFVCACNLVLIFLFVFHTSLGYRGIALSTATSVAVGSILNFRYLRTLLPSLPHFSLEVMKGIVAIGWPMGLTQVLWQLGSAALFLILSMLPENIEILAAFAAGIRIESAIFLPAFAFNMANAVVVGNLLGERKLGEAFRSGLVTAGVGVAVVTALTIFVILNARWIAGSLSDNPVVVRESIRYIYISMISEPFMAWGIILGGGLGGAGDTRNVMIRIAASVWLVRIPLCYVSVAVLGFSAAAVWWAMNISQFVQALLLTRRYIGRRWLPISPTSTMPVRDD
ncbi:MAG: MATE family efflux transporter [Desulfobacteraceae bacterium]|nr:MAG: MATE family efflux transporter [Desulfobacteraceae bacterium]